MKLGDDVKFSDGEGADDEEEKDEEEGDKSALGARTQVKAAHESPALVLIGTRTEKRLIHRKSPRRRCARHLFRGGRSPVRILLFFTLTWNTWKMLERRK